MDSKVYFIKAAVSDGEQVISEKALKLFRAGNFASCFAENDFTAVKVHVGEETVETYAKAGYIKDLADELKKLKTYPFITDTCTLYTGPRSNAVGHSRLAAEHGFSLDKTGLPFIVSDGLLGTDEETVEVNSRHNKQVYIAGAITQCQSILSIAHLTGHIGAGFGATLKTLGMGCASKKGKIKQHTSMKLSIGDKCVLCGQCIEHCPADAITLGGSKADIDHEKCISCAACMTHCRYKAVECNWGEEKEVLQESIAEYACGALKGKENKAVFFNFILCVTQYCDCFRVPDRRQIIDDIGIIASTDPVAVDKAALDMVENKTGQKFRDLTGYSQIDPFCQILHAERLSLGSLTYKVIEVD